MTASKQVPADEYIILFDGVCNLCERSVQFVIRHDPDALFSFAPLQSEYARTLMDELELEPGAVRTGELASFILIANGQASMRSDAWLRICSRLDSWPRWLGVFRFVPRFIRDAVYDFIGRHRYQWFGKKPECMVPTPDIRGRFRQ